MAQRALWGWYPAGNIWVKMQVDINGRLVLDPALLFEEPPVNGELERGATSNWCFDHDADPDAHHNRQHALNSAADHTGTITDVQHGVRTLANAHAHADISGVGANDHHASFTLADHLAIGNGAPHHAPQDIGEGHITILPWNYDSIGAGIFVLSTQPTDVLNGYLYNSAAANLDNLSYRAALAAGTYTLRFICRTNNDAAILDFDIDGVEVASFDCYSAGVVNNVIFTQAGIVIAADGLKTIRLRSDGRNGASTGWQIRITEFALWRTA